MTRTLLAAVLLFAATAASAQDPVTRRPGDTAPSRPAPTNPGRTEDAPRDTTDDARELVLRGREDWGTNGKLTFTLRPDGEVVMVDSTARPVKGKATATGNRFTFRFADCVYKGTLRGSALTGEARYTSDSSMGKTWSFRVRVVDAD